MTREQLLDGFKGISIRSILSHISVPRHQRRRDQVLGFVDKFIELAQQVAVTDDKTLMPPTELPLKDNFCRKAVTFRLFQQLLGDKVFPAIIRPQLGDPCFISNIRTVNSELGYIDPKLDEARFNSRVKSIPLSRLKPCLELVHRSRRKCLLPAPREELREALRMSMLERWNELLVVPPPLIGMILNCYVPDANYQSFYGICDVMDYEFGRDLCASVMPPMCHRNCVEKRRNIPIASRATAAAHVAEYFDNVEKNWPLKPGVKRGEDKRRILSFGKEFNACISSRTNSGIFGKGEFGPIYSDLPASETGSASETVASEPPIMHRLASELL